MQILQDLIVQQHHCESLLQVGSSVLVSESLLWTDYFCCSISVWRNCYWHDHMTAESWYSEPLHQLMESAVDIVLKPVGLASELGWHGWPKTEEGVV
jgi:hypothetical protein